jgi:hypothetical protein
VIKGTTHLVEKVISTFLPEMPTPRDQDELYLGG